MRNILKKTIIKLRQENKKKNILIKKTEQGPAQLREINNSLTSNNLKIAQEFNKLPATLT